MAKGAGTEPSKAFPTKTQGKSSGHFASFVTWGKHNLLDTSLNFPPSPPHTFLPTGEQIFKSTLEGIMHSVC